MTRVAPVPHDVPITFRSILQLISFALKIKGCSLVGVGVRRYERCALHW
jgi:hypothetical protein